MPDPVTHTIRVTFNHVWDEATHRFIDSIDYQPAVLWVLPGDEVQWISNYKLNVAFRRGSPFTAVRIKTPAAEELSDPETVLTSAPKRSFSYDTNGGKMEGSELRLSGDPGCPEIIVE
jgi:plastocyanin